ncbi:MAG: cysteine hydrolase [Ruminococcaceae bacterium]|nr:cysteine hydrolase [Oscillospiraceae bacterium]
MAKILIVVDMQNDFIDGALGTEEAVAIVPYVKNVIEQFDGTVYFTRDTHDDNYMQTQEGTHLPVPHCIKGTEGWQICKELDALRKTEAIDKVTFGSSELVEVLREERDVESITFVGLCTDICVISNAMVVKAFYPEIPLIVDAKGCAGVSPQSHKRALEAMKVCQMTVINE